MLTAQKKLVHKFNRDDAIVTGTHNVHLNGKNTSFLLLDFFSFLPSLKSHILYFLYFELENYKLFHRRSFDMINL